jgi:uncharacterized membrane protein
MTTHATSEKRWTETELNCLPAEEQFRLRGLEVTRLDTFIDAAFAFVLTLLIISFDEIPSTYPELIVAIKRIPAFAFSFMIVMMFWLRHRRISRRYGLENTQTILLSLALVFVVLVYVYPLRIIFEAFFYSISDGYFPSSFDFQSYSDFRGIIAFYSLGFFAMSLIISLLYRAALRNETALALNQIERRVTKLGMQVWAVAASFGPLVILLAFVLPETWSVYAGYVYFGLFFAMRIPGYLDQRRHSNT